MHGNVVQINISPGGMPKLPIPAARVSIEGVAGDWQKNRKYHGGTDRAICLFSAELYDDLREEGFDLAWGSVGENFTTRGFDLIALATGKKLRVGQCLIEITGVRIPCRNLNQWHRSLLSSIKGRSGWVAKVIEPGEVKVNDPIRLE